MVEKESEIVAGQHAITEIEEDDNRTQYEILRAVLANSDLDPEVRLLILNASTEKQVAAINRLIVDGKPILKKELKIDDSRSITHGW